MTSPDSPDRENNRIAATDWLFSLHRPYLDLMDTGDAPLQSHVPLLAYHRLRSPGPLMQRSMTNALRRSLRTIFPHLEVAISCPTEVAIHRRTTRWAELCERIEELRLGTIEGATQTLRLLTSLGFHHKAFTLGRALLENSCLHAQRRAEISYVTAEADYHLHGLQRAFDTGVLQSLAETDIVPIRLKFSIYLRLTVHSAKIERQLQRAEYFRAQAERLLPLAQQSADKFEVGLLSSAFYRGASFIPYMKGDKLVTREEMDIAVLHARSLSPATAIEDILARDALYFALESSSKVHQWQGDDSAALATITEAGQLDPLDSRSCLEVGDALVRSGRAEQALNIYRHGISLGPPGGAMLRYKAGYLCEQFKNFEEAIIWYLECIRIDPTSLSARQGLIRVASATGNSALKNWGRLEQSLSQSEVIQ